MTRISNHPTERDRHGLYMALAVFKRRQPQYGDAYKLIDTLIDQIAIGKPEPSYESLIQTASDYDKLAAKCAALEEYVAAVEKSADKAEAELAALKAQPSGVVPVAMIEALKYYANGDHFLKADPDAWDTCSGEPLNFQHDEAGTASVEDGSIAKAALESLNSSPVRAGVTPVTKTNDQIAAVMLLHGTPEQQAAAVKYVVGLPVTTVTAGGVDERAAFEAQLNPRCRKRNEHGDYVVPEIQDRWDGWQARAALSAPSHGEQVRESEPDFYWVEADEGSWNSPEEWAQDYYDYSGEKPESVSFSCAIELPTREYDSFEFDGNGNCISCRLVAAAPSAAAPSKEGEV